MVGEQLKRDDREQRDEALLGVGNLQREVGEVAHVGVALGDYADDPALARLYLLDVAEHLVVVAPLGGDDHGGHLVVDECDGSVLHLCGGVALCVYVRDFLELECALHGDGIVVSAAEVEEVAGVGEGLGELGDLVVVLEDGGDLVGDGLKFAHELGAPFVGDGSELFGDAERDEEEVGDLGGEGLGGGDAYLRSDVGVAAGVGGPGDGGAHYVAYSEQEGSGLLGEVDGCQGVGGLAGLRDGDHYVVGEDDGAPVAELGGVLHLDRDAGEVLDDVLAYEAGVPGGAASADDEALGPENLLAMVDDAGELDRAELGVEPSLHGVAQCARLLEYLLEHEVGEAALLDFVEAELELADDGGLLDVLEVGYLEFLSALDVGDLPLSEVHDLVGVLDDG